jgi:hypothetical protein
MAVGTAGRWDAPAPEPIPAWRQLRLLFGLRCLLTLRGFQRSKSVVFGAILAVLLFLPLALGLGFGLGSVLIMAPPAIAEQTLRATLLGIYLMWLLSPLLGFQLNDSYDITRLFVYPVSVRRLFVGSILGSLLDTTTLLLLPTLLAVIVGAATHGVFAAVIAFLTIPLFLFHTLALSQAVVLATAGILRSRKWRDFAIVAVPLFWVLYQVVSRMLLPSYFKDMDWRSFLRSPAWEAVNFLPPGCGARAVAAAGQGAYLPALGYLLLLGAYTVATVYLAAWLIGKAYEGEDVSLFKPKERTATAAAPRELASVSPASVTDRAGGLRLPPVVAAMVEKEVRYFLRDPFFRVALVNSLYLLVIGGFSTLSSSGRRAQALPGTSPLWFATSLLLFQQTILVYNQFGTDGAAAPVLFGFPSSRRQMILGKNLPLFALLAAENLLLGAVLCLLTRHAEMMPLILLWLLLALGVMFAIGNLMSVYFPSRVVMKGFRTQQKMANQGAAYTFLNLGVSLAALLLFAPALGALLWPWYWGGKAWLVLTVPLAVAYVAGLYLLSLKLAEAALLKREPEVLERVYRAPE